MNAPINNHKLLGSTPIRMRFDERDKVSVRGVALRYVGEIQGGSGHVFERLDSPGIRVAFDHAELWEARVDRGWGYEPNFFSDASDRARGSAGVSALVDVPRREHGRIMYRLGWAESFRGLLDERLAMLARGRRKPDPANPDDDVLRVSLSDEGMKLGIAIIERRRAEREEREKREAREAGAVVKRAPRGGTVVEVKRAPGIKALRGWIKALRGADWNPVVLRSKQNLLGSSVARVAIDAERMMARLAARYASANRPTKKYVYDELLIEIERHNAGLANGEGWIRPPSRDTFLRRIRQMDAFSVHCARHGTKAAQNKFRAVTIGVGAVLPGERVEIDEWMVQLQIILVWTGVWEQLTEEQRKKYQRTRVWICVAVDCATRVILGMAMSENPSSDAVLAVLRMIVSDKTAYAQGVGAKSPWSMYVRPKTIVTDAGSTFLNERVRAAISSLRIDNLTCVAGEPWMRGTIERLFRTIHTGLVSRLPGRTFEHTVALGDYESTRRAALTIDNLCWVLVRWVVDEYHNNPHQGLGGETPLNAWKRLAGLYGVAPPPDRDELRNVFGVEMQRRTGAGGILVLGLHYQSEKLQEHRRRHGDRAVAIRYDTGDIGSISVLLGDAWFPAQCMSPDFDGVSMGDWLLTAKALRMKHGDDAKLSRSIVERSIREIAELVRGRLLDTFGFDAETLSAEVVDRTERELLFGFTMPTRDDQRGEAPAFDDGSAGAGRADGTPGEETDGGVDACAGASETPGEPPPGDAPPAGSRGRLRFIPGNG